MRPVVFCSLFSHDGFARRGRGSSLDHLNAVIFAKVQSAFKKPIISRQASSCAWARARRVPPRRTESAVGPSGTRATWWPASSHCRFDTLYLKLLAARRGGIPVGLLSGGQDM